ncbi:ribonuclease III [Candidatus Sumerlaeota bacterium]|nr:ribonuclease III [Candidatus Sumerlaeota bacterium]
MTTERKELIQEFIKTYGLDSIEPSLLETALTHRSYVFETNTPGLQDNERLEFLGDAVINTVAAEYLYRHFEHASEGELSKLRARLVSRVMLARRAREMNLGALLRLGKGELQTGGRQRNSIIGAAIEAVVGAVYLSSGAEKAKEFVLNHIITPSASLLTSEDYLDYKSRLQELVQKKFHTIPEYRVVAEKGPEHKKLFTIEVWINGRKYGTGEGGRKKIAENIAAKEAYKNLTAQPSSYEN